MSTDQSPNSNQTIETVRIKRTPWLRIRDVIIGLGFVMITFGQFADTKELLTYAYHSFITHFTDRVELNNLAEVSVGSNPRYLEDVFGIARLIKPSQTDPDLEYRYYHAPKYLLGVAVVSGRVKGYMVTSLRDSFYPSVRFYNRALSEFSLAEYSRFNGRFTTDSTNLMYYLEGQQLGRQGLFLNQFMGYIDYAAQFSDRELVLTNISALNDELLMSEEDAVNERIQTLRRNLRPNFFVVGDFAIETAADMVLTRFEYQSHFAD